MRKTNSNIKRVYFMKKKLISFCIVQVVIFVVFATLFYQSRPFNNSECKDTIIIVENSEYTAVFREYEFRIYSNGIRYDFPNLGMISGYTAKELSESIKIGDVLELKYTERCGIFGKYNYIVGARGEDCIYVNFEQYNGERHTLTIFLCVLLIVIQLIVLLAVVSMIRQFFKLRRKRIYYQNKG